MLGFLFRGLTSAPQRGTALFDAITTEARLKSWYVEGEVPDTLDGRFAVLATVTALALARLEQEGDGGNPESAALTERFVAVMESEHRELGLGDPTLGKTVRKLVGMLARRTALWRSASADSDSWTEAARDSLYKDAVARAALVHSAAELKRFAERLAVTPLGELEHGRIA